MPLHTRLMRPHSQRLNAHFFLQPFVHIPALTTLVPSASPTSTPSRPPLHHHSPSFFLASLLLSSPHFVYTVTFFFPFIQDNLSVHYEITHLVIGTSSYIYNCRLLLVEVPGSTLPIVHSNLSCVCSICYCAARLPSTCWWRVHTV